MPRLLTFYAVLSALTLGLPAATTFAINAPATTKPAIKVPAVFPMPDAYAGMKYDQTGDPGPQNWKQPVTCVPRPALPAWLKLDCSKSTFHLSGTAPDAAAEVVLSIQTTVIDDDPSHVPALYTLKLTVRPIVGVVPMNNAAKEGERKVAPPPDYTKMKLVETMPIKEGAKEVAGQIANVPEKAALFVQLWTQPEGQQKSPWTQMTLVNPTTPPATVQQIAIKDNSYDLKMPAPLAAGQVWQLWAVTGDGTRVALLGTDTLSAAIPIGAMSLTVEEPLIVDSSTISGKLSSMPTPADPFVAASGSDAAFYGNSPGIVVWWTDPKSGFWSQAVPAISAKPSPFPAVNADGSFQVTLPSKLLAGQMVRVDVVPPPGRFFVQAAPLLPFPPPPASVPVTSLSEITKVVTDVALSTPTISSTPFNEGITVISGTATAPSSGVSLSVAILRLKSQADDGKPAKGINRCLTIDELDKFAGVGTLLPLTSSSSNTFIGSVDANAGTFKVTLADALKEGDLIQVVQVLPVGTMLPSEQDKHCASMPQRVNYPFNFYRTNLTFVAGVLLSNSSSSNSTSANFSQANQFYAFNADHAWRLPGSNCIDGHRWGEAAYGNCGPGNGWHADHIPGNQSFFESRLTSIPVSTPSTSITQTSSTSSNVSSPTNIGSVAPIVASSSSSPSVASTTTTAAPTLLTSQKVFRVGTGVYLPWIFGHSSGAHPDALFFAPLAKAGFDTVTGAGVSTNVILPGGTTGTLDFQTAYKFYAYGARLGNMSLSQSHNRAPLIEHYLDVTVGRYSNLQSYICHHLKAGAVPPHPVVEPTGTSCLVDYPGAFPAGTQVVDSRKQLYRLDFEGLVRIPIPATLIPFYIGFNANIAQHSWQAEYLDHGYAPPDDIRILFGTKIDIGTLLSSFKLGAN